MHGNGDRDVEFALPGIDDPASVETGVILMGFDVHRLLAGLGVTAFADDPAQVAVLVDHLRHGGSGAMDEPSMITAGARRWREARPALAATGGDTFVSAAPRQAWRNVLRVIGSAEIGALGPAGRAYLAACWLRRNEVDNAVEGTDAAPEVTS